MRTQRYSEQQGREIEQANATVDVNGVIRGPMLLSPQVFDHGNGDLIPDD